MGRGEWNLGPRSTAIDVKNEIVGEAGRKDQRSSFDRQGDSRLKQAGDMLGIGCTERWRSRILDGGGVQSR